MRPLISVTAAVLIGLLALTACNSRETTPKVAKSTLQTTTPPPPGDNARRITPAEVKEEMAKNDVVIIDVRGEPNYKAGHIKGARLIPATEILAHIDELPRDKLIVTYCS
ncbi:MAG: transcriptional regulator, ArsR family [Acidobacteria bacterium]|nr:transcriptional regulator, ArsR family [Acidobacteriota bacterium]